MEPILKNDLSTDASYPLMRRVSMLIAHVFSYSQLSSAAMSSMTFIREWISFARDTSAVISYGQFIYTVFLSINVVNYRL